MENRRLFSRLLCSLPILVLSEQGEIEGKLHNIGLGGAGFSCSQEIEPGQKLGLLPSLSGDFEPVTYEVQWAQKRDQATFHGLRYPGKISVFWDSWAANVLAGIDITNGEVLERRKLVRVPCRVGGKLTRGPEAHLGTLLNLGIGGALLLCQPHFPQGALFALHLDGPPKVQALECRVLRSWSRLNSWLYGVEFVTVSESQRDGLQSMLNAWLD